MPKKEKWYIGGAIVLALVVVIGVFYRSHVHFQSPLVFLPDPQKFISNDKRQPLSGGQEVYSLRSLREVAGGSAANELGYQDALLAYQGRALRFNANCRTTPVTIIMPPKNVIMLGNDSQYQRAVTIGERVYVLAPYDYVLASFNTTGQYNVSCDSVQDVAIISIQ